MKHKHHIIPKYMGGTDDPSNLIELSPQEHAESHRLLYEKYGNWQDRVAWKGLSGLISKEDVIKEMYEQRRGKNNPMYGKSVKDFMTNDEIEEWRKKLSNSGKGKSKSKEHKDKIKNSVSGSKNGMYGKIPWNKGKVGVQIKSLETKKKISKPIMFHGVEYYSIKEAAKQNNTSSYYVMKAINGVNTPFRNRATSK
jgi:hypothetical protein